MLWLLLVLLIRPQTCWGTWSASAWGWATSYWPIWFLGYNANEYCPMNSYDIFWQHHLVGLRAQSCEYHSVEPHTNTSRYSIQHSVSTNSETQVTFLLLMKYFRPRLYVMIEQPTSSWMFKQRCFKEVAQRWNLKRFLTHQGFWGHDLLKPTHLLGSFSSLSAVETTATKKKKRQHKKEVRRKRKLLKSLGLPVKTYYKRLPNGRFQGGPDLAASAIYPPMFLEKVYRCWVGRHMWWWKALWSVAKVRT